MKELFKRYDKDIILFYLYSIFSGLDFSRGIFVIYLMDKDISIAKIGILQTILFLTNLIAEVPAGIIADKSRRKFSVAFGLMMLSLAALGFLYFTSFYGFLLVFSCLGIGFAFQSGADIALIYDNLKSKGVDLTKKYISVLAKSRTFATLALAFAIFAGGKIKEFSWSWVFILFSVAMAIGAIIIMFIKEPKTHSQNLNKNPHSIIHSLKIFMKAREGKKLLFFIFGMGFIEATAAPFFIYIQKLFADYNVSTIHIGMIIAASQLITAFIYQFTSKFESWKLSSQVKIASLVLFALIVPIYFRPHAIVVAVLFLLIEAIPSLLFIFTDNHINDNIPSHIRASVLSVQSFVSAIFVSLSFLGCGFFMEKFPSNVVLSSLAILPIIGLLLLSKYFFSPLESRNITNV